VDQAVRGEVIVVRRRRQPVAELRAAATSPVRPARVAGLLKGQVRWEPGAFAPMSNEELADFDRGSVVPQPPQP
jgi:hypothetical protein